MAQSRTGADRLLESGLLSVLTECDFVDTRPESDQSFIGWRFQLAACAFADSVLDRDSFLPSAIQRYHQLFLPALQVVTGVLTILGPNHTSACNQVRDLAS